MEATGSPTLTRSPARRFTSSTMPPKGARTESAPLDTTLPSSASSAEAAAPVNIARMAAAEIIRFTVIIHQTSVSVSSANAG